MSFTGAAVNPPGVIIASFKFTGSAPTAGKPWAYYAMLMNQQSR